ncbi:MAG: choice-of-anchor D domain-containing protein [Pirellulaceae bacterium]|nr:choice-of-anchor D domain-containing protein [Pirellulaceae bacterium]
MLETLETRQLLATIAVTTFDDIVDGGDGLTSLREAIDLANTNGEDDRIELPAGTYDLTLAPVGDNANAGGDLDVGGDGGHTTEIVGLGVGAAQTLIRSQTGDRVLDVLPGAVVTLDNLTVTGGQEARGGGIYNGGTLTIAGSRIESNTAEEGGGIYNADVLRILDSTVTLNVADGVFARGGGIASGGFEFGAATLYLERTDVSYNRAEGTVEGRGGGISSLSGMFIDVEFNALIDEGGEPEPGACGSGFSSLEVCHSSIHHNEAISGGSESYSLGGGVDTTDGVIVHSTIHDNLADLGGGIYNAAPAGIAIPLITEEEPVSGSLDISNSTVTNNRSAFEGGGIYNDLFARLTLEHVTISHNAVDLAEPEVPLGGGGIFNNDGSVLVHNTIVARNTGSPSEPIDPDVSGVFTSFGFNLIGDIGFAVGFGSPGDQVGGAGQPVIDPLLGDLLDNGGHTLTRMPQAGSRAVDRADRDDFLDKDQRGVDRPVNPRADIGAVERDRGSLHGQKYEDLNANGLRDPGEPGLNGWTIQLVDPNGTVVDSVATIDKDMNGDQVIDPARESGWYWFDNVPFGDYVIREVPQFGWFQMSPAGGAGHAVTVGPELVHTFTVDADFDQGSLFQLNHDAPNNDQLQLDDPILVQFPFINVALSGKGTMARINTLTGQTVAEYWTAPQGFGLNPSRTTVDLFGNVWVGNRNEESFIGGVRHGSVTKFGLVIGGTRGDKNPDGSLTPNPAGQYLQGPFDYATCNDRDGDGLLHTSGALGQVLAWTNATDGVGGTDNPQPGGAAGDARVQDAVDECILVYQRVRDADAVRHVSVDANNDVWVGGYPFALRSFHLLDGETGAVQDSFDARTYGAGGYGGLIDGNGVLWSASISQNTLLRYDPATNTGLAIPVPLSYGLGIDNNGFIWNATWTDNRIVKVAPNGTIQPGFPKPTGGQGARGVAVTPADNHVWVANSLTNNVSRLDNNGNVLAVIPVGSQPTGVAVDSEGKVWVTNLSSDNIMRINPATNSVDLTVPTGGGSQPYNYSDMTGQIVVGSTAPQGQWSVVQDGGGPTEWTNAYWNTEPEGSETLGSSITVEVRVAETQAGLGAQPFLTVTNGGSFSLVGRYIEIRSTLRPGEDHLGNDISPILSDLSVTGRPLYHFGNAAEGSVHGYKFEDLDADGVWDAGEPPLAGVEIVLSWTTPDGTSHTATTTTDERGEYWFQWLRPGLNYTVTEVPPAGSVQTTVDPPALFITSGKEWVASPEQGRQAQLTFAFPWWWEVVIDPVPRDGVDPPPQTVMLEGIAELRTSDYLDPATGQIVAPLAGNDGLPLPPPPGVPLVVETEIVAMSLSSVQPIFVVDSFFDVFLDLSPGLPQPGRVQVQLQNNLPPTGAAGLVGDSFFDVFFDIAFVDPATGERHVTSVADPANPQQRGAMRVGMAFGPVNPPPTPSPIPPRDIRWMPTFFWQTGTARELRDLLPDGTLGTLWDEIIAIHAVPHAETDKPVRPMVEPALTFGNTYLGSIHGYKFEDVNFNGMDDNEPRLAGVLITLSGDVDGDGDVDSWTQSTNDQGEYWFEGLYPGVYTVSETPSAGTFPTTATRFTVTVLSRQELVALPGQAHLNPGDPRVEVVIGPALVFGNAYAGSIHGFKFEDRNADGVYQGATIAADNGSGTVDLPAGPLSGAPGELLIVSDGLPQNSTLRSPFLLDGIHDVTRSPGGSLGGEVQQFGAALQLDFNGTGTLSGYQRSLELDILLVETHSGPRTPGDPVQSFDTDMFRLASESLIGDPDFDLLRITGGTAFGLPSPGHTTLTRLPGGDFQVDSFFDITYRIDFVGAPGGPLAGMSGSTTGTIRAGVGGNGNDLPMPGITFVLQGDVDGDGDLDQLTETTNQQGEFWFTGLFPGDYSVHEAVNLLPPGVVPTTDTSTTLTIQSREELVWREGAAMLPAGSPQREVLVGDELVFGNTYLGSIHGYKFEDVNVNGLDDGEPRLSGVLITLTGDVDGDGDLDLRSELTNNQGEYWFEGLYPGVYTVSETPPAGTFPTTETSFTVTVASRQELVALPGQAHLPLNDPRVEVVIGPQLAFGNAYPGSIHGFKFEDANGDGNYLAPVIAPDNGGGTVDLPVGSLTNPPDEPWQVIDGLPPGTTLEGPGELSGFRNVVRSPGGSLGGEVQQFQADLHLDFEGTGSLAGYQRSVSLLTQGQTASGPRTPGQPVQVFDTDFETLQGQLIGDPDFDLLRVTAGTSFGLPSPGHTTLTRLADGNWQVDSFFDITYRIDFVGAPGGPLAGMSGSTTATIRMASGGHDQPLPGITFVLQGDVDGDGDLDQVTETTNQQGEFWFTGLFPGVYSVHEAVNLLPPGVVPTTDTSATLTIQSREELVWRPGAAMLPPGSPQREVLVGSELMFGNTYLGSIHGYKFEDLNVNGIDDGEPRLGNVAITLTGDIDGDGVVDTIIQRTNTSGEYWFEGLYPGVYTVSETPPQGSIPTTPVSYTVTVASRQELVALPGQAHLPANDPRVEVVIGPELAFGNAFEGSIHGYKFEDLDGDGVWDAGEPPLAGVEIVLSWLDRAGNAQTTSTTTDDDGEYWFTWLEPGLTYTVTEVPPAGSVQTTTDPPALFISSGKEWVATPEQGREVQLTFGFPWIWELEIDPVPRDGVDPPPQIVMLQGFAELRTSEYLDPATGQVVAPLADNQGLPLPPPPGVPLVVETEIVALSLTSVQPIFVVDSFFDVFVDLSAGLPQQGRVQVQLQDNLGPTGASGLVGDSFFDIFFDITFVDRTTGDSHVTSVSDPDNPSVRGPIRVGMPFGPVNPPPTPSPIPPHDIRWMPTFFWQTGRAHELRDLLPDGTLGNLWDEIITIHGMPNSENEKPVRPMVEPLLAFGNAFTGSIHGYKFEDLNGNGVRDELHLHGGVEDQCAIANGPESATPGAGLLAHLAHIPVAHKHYDDTTPNRFFGETFAGLPSGIESGTLRIGLKPHSDIPGNDTLGLHFFAPDGTQLTTGWAAMLGTLVGQTWNQTNFPNGTVVTLDLDNLPISSASLLAAMSTHGQLDVIVQDDTAIDFIELWLGTDGGPLGGVPFELTGTDNRGNAVGPLVVSTNNDGEFWFTGLAPGNYTVREAVGLLPPGLRPTADQQFEVTILSRQEFVWRAGAAMLPPGSPQHEIVVGDELVFGNTYLGSIHGYKFDDLNANGNDDNEPRWAGVTITLSGDTDGNGTHEMLMMSTDNNGEYWFEGLWPGEYTVSELPPAGSAPTTPTSYTVTIRSRQELVALPGQAHLPPGDPRVEVVVGPELAFGNSAPGSIHGYKFDDRNADGDWDLDEPPLAGVVIVLSWTDTAGQSQTLSAPTDSNGEYWFLPLRPGLTYRVTEIPPENSGPTTPLPPPLLVGSGQEYVATAAQRDALIAAGIPADKIVIEPRLAFGNAIFEPIEAPDLRSHWDLGDPNSSSPAANSGRVVFDEADLSLRGNQTVIGRPTGPLPITPDPGEMMLDFFNRGALVGALTADDRFDFRDGSIISGSINGRGGNDSIDYRDVTHDVLVDLATGSATDVRGGLPGGLVAGTGGPLDGSSLENVFGGNANDTIAGDQDHNILGDGHGNDRLDGGAVLVAGQLVSGDDTFQLEPGLNEDGTGASSDVLTDLNGNDTVEFRFADSRVMFDLDLLEVPQDAFAEVPGDQFVTLSRRPEHVPISPSMFENMVGSQYNDLLYIDPLDYGGDWPENGSPVIRNVDGNDPPDDGNSPDPGEPIPPGDTLYFEAFGQPVRDTGYSISAEGISTVTYQSIETLIAVNQRPRIIDNGDADFHERPITATDNISPLVHWGSAVGTGFGGDYLFHLSQQPPGPNTTTWRFEGTQPGWYRVSATWPAQPSHPLSEGIATDAPFTIFDDDFKLATRDMNQSLAPNDFVEDGVAWEQLGVFQISSHTLVVQLSDLANGQVLADAIRLERISEGPELTVLAGAEYVLDGISDIEMTTTVGDSLQRQFTIRNDGTAPLVIDDIDLTLPGEVNPSSLPVNYLLIPAAPSFPLTLAPGDTFSFSVQLQALTDPFPGDPLRDGHGGFPGELRIFSNDIDETIRVKNGAGVNPNPEDNVAFEYDPFTFQIRGVVSNRTIIDNGDAGFQLVGTWPNSSANGFQGDLLASPSDASGEQAVWTFTDLPDGVYRVSATYAGSAPLTGATASPFTVSDINGQIGSASIDQSVSPHLTPGAFLDEGAWWVDLGGPYMVSGGTIVVNLLDTINQPNRFVIADAVRIERLLENKPGLPVMTAVPDVTVLDGASSVIDNTGVVDFGSTWPQQPLFKTFTIRNDGGAPLVVREPVTIPPGFTLLDFTVPAGGTSQLPTGMSQFTLLPGDAMEMRVRFNGGYPGVFDGELSLPTGDTSSPPLHVDPDETPFNFRMIGTIHRWQLIDNQDVSGFAASGGFLLSSSTGLASAQGFNSAVHFANPGASVETATWTFDDLTPGARYIVSATWSPYPNRATNAPFTVSGVAGGPTLVPLNQRLTPDDRAAHGTQFEDLGIFTASGGSLTVSLSTLGANGQVIADAVRIEQVVDPEIRVFDTTGGGVELFDGRGVIDVGQTTVGGADLTRTIELHNTGSRPLALGAPILPVGFELLGAFPAGVPVGGSSSFTLQLPAATSGAFSGALLLPADDYSENPFEILLTGDVLSTGSGRIFINNENASNPPNTSYVNSGFQTFTNQGRLGSVDSSGFTVGGDTATFQATLLPDGLYRISSTWTAFANRAVAAPYAIYNGVVSPANLISSVTLNQQLAPDDFTDDGSAWEDVDIVRVVGGTLTVRLTESGLGEVIADAIRLERLPAQPEIRLTNLGANETLGGGDDQLLVDGVSTVDFGAPQSGGSSTRTFLLENRGDVSLELGQLRLPLVFSLLTAPATTVAPGGTTTFRVQFTPSRVDTFSGELRLFNNDSTENPFNVALVGSVAPPQVIIDNGDAGYAQSGGFVRWTGQGFAGSDNVSDVAEASGGGDTATWTFNVMPNTTYRVSATWTAASNRASNAPFTISGISGGPVTTLVNQKVSPADFSDAGASWEDLSIVRSDGSGMLVVSLSDTANGNVIADAIRLEPLPAAGPEILVSEGGIDVPDGAGSLSFSGVVGGSVTKTFQVVNSGTATLTLSNASLAASLAAISGFSLASGFVSTSLAPGDSTTFVIQLDTGAVGNFAGTVSFDSNDADESPYTFAVSGQVITATRIIDNNGPVPAGDSYADSGNLTFWSGQGFGNDVREAPSGGAVETATYTFNNLSVGAVYKVSATWTAFGNRATNAPYQISGVAGGPTTVPINQQAAPNDFADSGVNWENLGTFTTTGTTLTVVLSGATTGNVIADAIRLERLVGPEIQISQASTAIADGGSFDFGDGLVNVSPFSKVFTIQNLGADPLIVGATLTLPAGFTLGATSNAGLFNGVSTFSIPAGGSETFEVVVNTSVVASYSGVLSLANNDADEAPYNFNIQADIVSSIIIDNQSSGGFASTPGFGLYFGQGFMNSVRAEFSPNGGDTATWTFSALPAGNYRVSTTWSVDPNRASNARFTISSTVGGASSGPILINQKLAPGNGSSPVGSSVVQSGATFADLVTSFAHSGGNLVVTLSDTSANGWIIADAVRVAAPGALRIELPDGPVQGESLDDSRIQPFIQQAIGYWTQLDAAHAARLQGVELLIRDLPPGVLGLGSFAAPQIWLDDDAAGHGWRLDSYQLGGVDLLTVITHELGHVLGLPDLDPLAHAGDIMSGRLTIGESRVAGGELLAALGGRASFGRLPAADRVFGLLESRAVRADGFELRGTQRSHERLAAVDVPWSPERAVVDLVEPLWDERRRRQPVATADSATDDFFTELGASDEAYEHRLLDE